MGTAALTQDGQMMSGRSKAKSNIIEREWDLKMEPQAGREGHITNQADLMKKTENSVFETFAPSNATAQRENWKHQNKSLTRPSDGDGRGPSAQQPWALTQAVCAHGGEEEHCGRQRGICSGQGPVRTTYGLALKTS